MKAGDETKLAERVSANPAEYSLGALLLSPGYWTNVAGVQVIDVVINSSRDNQASYASIGTIIEEKTDGKH